MNNELREQISRNMNLKDTDELLEIWKTNDRVAWSDIALDVVREILSTRVGELPPQNEPILSYEEAQGEEDEDESLGLEKWEAKLIDNENQPVYYDTLEVIDLRRRLDQIARLVIGVNIIYGIAMFPITENIVYGFLPADSDRLARIVISSIGIGLGVIMNMIMMYFPLKALSQVLRVLMEMEFNSRK